MRLRHLLSIVLTAITGAALISTLTPSEAKEIFVYSYLRAAALVGMTALLGYLLVSLRSPRLLAINNLVILNAAAVLVACELWLRQFPASIPEVLLPLLSEPARIAVSRATGLFKEEATIHGDGLLFSYLPHLRLAAFPHLRIDENGYRNPQDGIAHTHVDTVVLGDSVTMAINATADIADFVRRDGGTAYSLAFGSYGPPLYRDVFDEYVVHRKVRFTTLLIGVCLWNDIADSWRYDLVKAAGGSYREYLSTTPLYVSTWDKVLPWSISLTANTIYWVRDRHRGTRAAGAPDAGEERNVTVRLPYSTLVTKPFNEPYFPEDSPQWRSFVTHMRDLIARAFDAGAQRVVVLTMPTPGQIYAPFLEPEAGDIARYVEETRSKTLAAMESFLSRPGVRFVDPTPAIREAARSATVSSDGRLEYHLSDHGVRATYELLADALRRE